MNRLRHWPLTFWILACLLLGGGLLVIQNNGSKTPIATHRHENTVTLSIADRSYIESLSTSFVALEEALGAGSSLTPFARSVESIAQPALKHARIEGNSALVTDYSHVLSDARSIVAHPQSSVSGRWRQASSLSGYVDTLMTTSIY